MNRIVREGCVRLGERLRTIRLGLDMSQEEAAEAIGIHSGYLQRVETGKTNVTFGILLAISLAYGVPLQTLFETPTQLNAARPAPKKAKRAKKTAKKRR